MNKRISLGAAIAFIFIIAAATFSMTMIYSQRTFNERVSNLKKREVMYDKYTEIDRVIRENYIGAINETQLMDSVAQGYIQGVGDKYGRYISAEEYARMTAMSTEGENVGIGAVAETTPEGYLVVKEVYPDSPALAAGLEAGDLIIKIDDIDLTVDNINIQEAMLYGQQGTKISLIVRRGGQEMSMPDVPRRSVMIPSVYSHMIADTTIGYIWIKEFNSSTSDQFNRELDRVISAGAQTLIFDVRDNKGGVMKQATRIIDRLVPSGIIYTAQRKDGTIEQVTSDGNAIDMPMAVLANSGTASAAELFAQVLKDYDKAKIIGVRTAGKGVLQDIIKLSDGSAIDITAAYYNPPVSPNYDGIGINPDYEVILEGDWTLMNEESDTQLKKAMEVVTAIEKVSQNQTIQESGSDEGEEASENG